jgi:hypothetical protein
MLLTIAAILIILSFAVLIIEAIGEIIIKILPIAIFLVAIFYLVSHFGRL